MLPFFLPLFSLPHGGSVLADVSIRYIHGQGGADVQDREFEVVAVMLFGQQRVGRFPTREQAEWRARELNAWAERSPRGIVQYMVRPAKSSRRDRRPGETGSPGAKE